MRFVWVMARREMRGAARHVLFFLACIMLGVGSLVGVAGFSANLERVVRQEARALMAGDVEVRANRPLSEAGRGRLAALEPRGARIAAVSEMIAMASDVSIGATSLVELKAVGEGYPFYGTLKISPSASGGEAGVLMALADGSHALVEEGLLFRLGVRVGDEIVLGQARFRIAGVILKEPDRAAGAFSLGPRVMVAQEGLARTGLVQQGSRVRYRYLLKLPAPLSPSAIADDLKAALTDEGVQVNAYDRAEPRLNRFLKNLTTYLGLAGVISLFVGGIGVATSIRAFLKERLDTLAILRCLGVPSRTVLGIYLLQTLWLGGLGSLAGVGVGIGVQALLPVLLSRVLPERLPLAFAPLPILQGMAMGILATLLFALWPLWEVRRVPPAQVFRREVTDGRPTIRLRGDRPWLAAGIAAAALAGMVVWQIGSFKIGGTFLGILAATMFVLWLAAWGGVRLLARLFRRFGPRPLVWRQGLANLIRPGSQATTAALSLGVGVTVVLALYLVEAALLRQIDEHLPKEAPSFFFIDIQPDQKARFERLMAERHQAVELTPIVRARLHAVNDRRVAEMDLEKRPDNWYFYREYVVTSQEALPKGNRVTQGAWWTAAGDRPMISVEEDAARHLGIGIGATLTLDVSGGSGRLVRATVTSLRQVNWGNLSTNFFVVFSPGALEHAGAPVTYLATTRTSPGEDAALQRAVVAAFPNVTAISIRHVLEAVHSVLDRLALVFRFVGGFTIVAALLVLSGAIATTRYLRLRESVILKTLGATRRVIAKIFAVEYAVLGAVAGLIGSLMAMVLAAVFLGSFFDIPWQIEPVALMVSVLGAVGLAVLSGFLTTYRILGHKPLAVLRHE